MSTSSDRLSFLSLSDQQKFQSLFQNATNSLSISPEAARPILLKSNLSHHLLARIWELADINRTGDLMFPEFALALHLCNVVLRGGDLPYQLDPQIKKEVSDIVDKISFGVPENGDDQPSLPQRYNPISTNDILEDRTAVNDISGHSQLVNQPTGFGFGGPIGANGFLNYQPTGLESYQQQQIQQPQQGSTDNKYDFSAQTSAHKQNFTQQLNGLPVQLTGFNQLSQQPTYSSQNNQLQFDSTPLSNNLNGSNQLNGQTPGFNPLNKTPLQSHPPNSGLAPVNIQLTGGEALKGPINGTISVQLTGGQPLKQQPTGLVPISNQFTGGQPLQQQPTGLIPIPTGSNQLTGTQSLKQQPTGLAPLTNQFTGGQHQPTELIPIPTGSNQKVQPLTQQPTGLVPLESIQTGGYLKSQPTGFGAFEPLRQQKTGVGHNSFFLKNLLQEAPQGYQTSLYANESIKPEEKQLFSKIFDNYDTKRKGLITGDISAEIFRKSGLNREELEKVWDLITKPNQTHLDKESFQIGMWLVYKRLNGYDLPEYLPESLIPSSLKILDEVKSKLKSTGITQTTKRSSNSRVDGSRFKNNDDEIKVSSSRHRRRVKTDEISDKPEIQSDIGSIEDIKKKIWEKRILLEALEVGDENLTEQSKVDNEYDLHAIEKLIEQLNDLPVSNTISNEQSALKNKFAELNLKIPDYISKLSNVDNEITNLKLEIFKIKNPSSIVGTGPNGSITDADKRKAKSKALLATKMAKLTGKPIDPEVLVITQEEAKLSEEVVKIQQENEEKQKAIKDIQSSIEDLSNGIRVALSSSKKSDDDEYKKWELGIGTQPEVQEIIKKFRTSEVSTKFSTLKQELELEPPTVNKASKSTFQVATPELRSPEDRRAYIKEQAQKRMNERLAKLGISRHFPLAKAEEPEPNPKDDDDSSSSDEDEEESKRMEDILRRKRAEGL